MISPADATAIACDQPVTTSRNGKHNAGQACLACHDGGDAARFTVGGTLYSGVASTTPVVGATIHVTDSMGTNAVLVTATNGNFWTTQTLAFPLTVRASRCPDSKPMVSPVTQTGGSCNLSGCHTAGFRIHLP